MLLGYAVITVLPAVKLSDKEKLMIAFFRADNPKNIPCF